MYFSVITEGGKMVLFMLILFIGFLSIGVSIVFLMVDYEKWSKKKKGVILFDKVAAVLYAIARQVNRVIQFIRRKREKERVAVLSEIGENLFEKTNKKMNEVRMKGFMAAGRKLTQEDKMFFELAMDNGMLFENIKVLELAYRLFMSCQSLSGDNYSDSSYFWKKNRRFYHYCINKSLKDVKSHTEGVVAYENVRSDYHYIKCRFSFGGMLGEEEKIIFQDCHFASSFTFAPILEKSRIVFVRCTCEEETAFPPSARPGEGVFEGIHVVKDRNYSSAYIEGLSLSWEKTVDAWKKKTSQHLANKEEMIFLEERRGKMKEALERRKAQNEW